MKRTTNWLGLALMLAPQPRPEPLKVSTVVAPKPHFVGQGVEVTVEVEPGPAPPTIDPPRMPGAEVFAMPVDPAKGATRRFVIVPAHAGSLDLPAFRVRSGERSGASRPSRLSVANVPPEGRASAFLGGVGPFEIVADAEPANVRPGETLEFRVKISGPAAWGSVRAPDPSEWISPTLTVEPLASSLQVDGPPSRTFRYRVRPLKAGKVVLPPVAVAAFDPTTRRYATKTTSGVSIRVEEPPRFDPDRLIYGPIARPDPGLWRRTVGFWVGLVGIAFASGSALAVWIVAKRKARATDPGRLALGLARGLETVDDEVEAARAVAEALTTFLQRAGGRAPGVLTPPEARVGFERLTGDPELATAAEALVSRCDRARYGRVGDEARGMVEDARGFFERVAEVMARADRKGGGPGEAVEAATNR